MRIPFFPSLSNAAECFFFVFSGFFFQDDVDGDGNGNGDGTTIRTQAFVFSFSFYISRRILKFGTRDTYPQAWPFK
jgi:hypothetical protein